MPYITSAERIGIEKVMLTDAREMVLEALDIKFSRTSRGRLTSRGRFT